MKSIDKVSGFKKFSGAPFVIEFRGLELDIDLSFRLTSEGVDILHFSEEIVSSKDAAISSYMEGYSPVKFSYILTSLNSPVGWVDMIFDYIEKEYYTYGQSVRDKLALLLFIYQFGSEPEGMREELILERLKDELILEFEGRWYPTEKIGFVPKAGYKLDLDGILEGNLNVRAEGYSTDVFINIKASSVFMVTDTGGEVFYLIFEAPYDIEFLDDVSRDIIEEDRELMERYNINDPDDLERFREENSEFFYDYMNNVLLLMLESIFY